MPAWQFREVCDFHLGLIRFCSPLQETTHHTGGTDAQRVSQNERVYFLRRFGRFLIATIGDAGLRVIAFGVGGRFFVQDAQCASKRGKFACQKRKMTPDTPMLARNLR